jgi:hypothetical protein
VIDAFQALARTLGPLAAEGQQTGKVARIGVLHPGTSQTPSTKAFQEELRNLGYVEGQTLGIEWRWAAGKSERYREDTLLEAGISSRRQAKYQRRMASLLAGRAR